MKALPYPEIIPGGVRFLEPGGLGAPPSRERRSSARNERLGDPPPSFETIRLRGASLPHCGLQKGDHGTPPRGAMAKAGFGVEEMRRGGGPCPRGAGDLEGKPGP